MLRKFWLRNNIYSNFEKFDSKVLKQLKSKNLKLIEIMDHLKESHPRVF